MQGTYGTVEIQDDCAVKKFNNDDEKNIFWKEVIIMTMLKNIPGFVKIQGYNYDERTIVMDKYEYDLTTLSSTLPLHKRLFLVNSIMKQCLSAINVIHSKGIVHGDLKASNIMCDYNSETNEVSCYIGDFSISSINNLDIDNYSNYKMYKPPEPEASKQVDIWMLGMSMIEFITDNISEECSDSFQYEYKMKFPYIILDNETEILLSSLLICDPETRFAFTTRDDNLNSHLLNWLNKRTLKNQPRLHRAFSTIHQLLSKNNDISNSSKYDDLASINITFAERLIKPDLYEPIALTGLIYENFIQYIEEFFKKKNGSNIDVKTKYAYHKKLCSDCKSLSIKTDEHLKNMNKFMARQVQRKCRNAS